MAGIAQDRVKVTITPQDGNFILRSGSVTAKIYAIENRGKTLYTLAYYHLGERKRQNFADLNEATKQGIDKVRSMVTGHHAALNLTDEEKHAYIVALDAVKPTGKRLELASAEYAEAWKILKNGSASIIEAARYYTKHHLKDIPAKKVPEVYDELLKARKSDGASDWHLRTLKKHLKKFKESFNCYIQNLTSIEINEWLRKLDVSPRTRNNHRGSIVNLFNFAKASGYLPKDQETEADSTSSAKEIVGRVKIFTPLEMVTLLKHADEELIPFLAIGGFAGVRHEEILRLSWKDVSFADGVIFIDAENAKTASHRDVPILPNLKAWLKPYSSNKGHVCEFKNMSDKIIQLCEKIQNDPTEENKIIWHRNGLRHSFGTYRLARIKNVAQVSYEMGNTPKMVFKHYRKAGKGIKNQAKEWFNIFPKKGSR